MSLAYVSLGASIFVLVSLFAPSSSVCIAIHIAVFFKLFRFCHSHYSEMKEEIKNPETSVKYII